MPLLGWFIGGAAVGAGVTYTVSDTAQKVALLAAIAGGVYLIAKKAA